MKTSYRGYCLDTFEKLMGNWPVGSYLVMKSNPRFPGGRPLMTIGYKCKSSKFLVFITDEGGRITEPCYPYLYHFPYMYYNVYVRPVVHPHLLGSYFNACNAIDNHNSIRQSDLSL